MWFLLLLACREEPETDGDTDAQTGPPACGLATGPEWTAPTLLPRDGELDLNDLQAAATHNSYHVAPDSSFDASHEYTQPPLAEQLALGFRGLELDLHLRDDGGLDVFHLPNIDDGTTCLDFTDCLVEVCTFSAANPGHSPLMIWLEPKDELDVPIEGWQELIDHYDTIEAEILEVFPRDRVFAPDDWIGVPKLAEVRGKVIFGLLDSSAHRDAYLAPDPTLAGRLLFPDSPDNTQPWSAFVKDADPDDLPGLLAQDLNVTATADGVSSDDADNQAERDGLIAGGAHWIATDLPKKVEGRDYWLDWPTEGGPVRCNPVMAPADCEPSDLE